VQLLKSWGRSSQHADGGLALTIVIVTIVRVAPLESNTVAETPALPGAGVPLTQTAGNREISRRPSRAAKVKPVGGDEADSRCLTAVGREP
jgi:hypothetical protein